MIKQSLDGPVHIFRVGALRFNMIQEAEQDFRVFVEEDSFNPDLLTYLLPVPTLTVNVRKSIMLKENGNKRWGRR